MDAIPIVTELPGLLLSAAVVVVLMSLIYLLLERVQRLAVFAVVFVALFAVAWLQESSGAAGGGLLLSATATLTALGRAALAFIGGKMLWEAFHEDADEDCGCEDTSGIDLREFLVLAVATSIDALAAGISFAALSVDIVTTVTLIGVITFALSFAGVAVGHFFGARYERPASVTGGVVLILIGLKVLLEHLGVLAL